MVVSGLALLDEIGTAACVGLVLGGTCAYVLLGGGVFFPLMGRAV